MTEDAPEPKPKPGRLRRWSRRIALGVLALLGAVLVTVLLALTTSVGTRISLRQGAAFYSEMIPGSIEFERSEGALSEGTTIRKLSVRDASGSLLVEVDRLKLGLDLPAVLGRTIDTGTIEIEGAVVDISGNFADLGPAGPSEPSPPSPVLGPDLPLEIRGTLAVRSLQVRDGPVALADVHSLDVQIWGAATSATVQLQTSAALPVADLRVEALSLSAAWDSPALQIPELLAQTSEGTLWLADTSVDFEAERFELGAMQARANTRYLGALVPGEPTGEATVLLDGGGRFGAMLLEGFVEAPYVGSASLVVEGGITNEPWASVLLNAGLEETSTESGVAIPALAVELEAEAHGNLDVGFDARVDALCVGCDQDLDPIRLEASGRASPGAAIVRLDADISASTLSVRADLRGSALLGAVGAVSVRIPRLADFSPVIDRFAPGLDLRGEVTLDAYCGALVNPQLAVCRTIGGVARGLPVRDLGFDVSVGADGERIAALIHSLRLQQGHARIQIGPKPARILYTPDVVTARDVRARIGTEEGLGALAVDGALGLTGDQNVELSARLSSLPLKSLRSFMPSLDVSGTLSTQLDVAGTLSAPTLDAHLQGRGLRYDAALIGNVGLDTHYSGTKLAAKLDVQGGELGTIAMDASVPVIVDVQESRYELMERRPSSLSLTVANANLEVARLAGPRLESLQGHLDLRLEQAGSIARPKLHMETAVRDGAFEGHALPDLGVRVQYAAGSAEAALVATHPEAFERLQLFVVAPLRLDILRGAAKLRAGESVQADLELSRLNLGYAHRFDERIATTGFVSADCTLRGDPAAPQLDVSLEANGLTWQGQAAGDLSLAASYSNDLAVARLWAAGPEVSGIGVDASVPLTLDLAVPTAQWHSERPHDLQVAVNELLVKPTLARIPDAPPLDLDARLHAVLELHGPATRPALSLHAEAEDIVYSGREAGKAVVDANYDKKRAHAEVLWNAPKERSVWVSADAPVTLDLPKGTAAWNRQGEHHVRVSIPRLDPVLVAPFLDMREFEGAVAVHAIVDGSLEDFDGSLSARGVVGGRGKTVPLDARIVVAPTHQSASVDLGSSIRIRATTKAVVAELLNGGDWTATEVEGTADIDALRTSDFSAFLPNEVQNLRGRLDAHVTVGGRLGTPQLDGSLAIRDGAVTLVPARVRLTELDVASSFSNQGLKLDRLSFRAADGSVSASGDIDVVANKGLRADLELDVKKFPVRAPGLPRMALSTRVRAKGFANLDKLDVNVGVGKTLVDVYASSISAADPIPSNSNVVLADLSKPQAPAIPASDAPDAGRIPKHITVDFGDDIRIVGPSINMRWAGKLETNVSESGATTSGKLNAKKGTFSLLGNEFAIEQGDVYLAEDGSAMPFIDVKANTSVDEVVISVAIRGPASRPEFLLSSVPALPQSELFTILVTGTSDTQGADSEEVQDKAAAILAAMSNSALQRQIGQKLRVDKVGVGFGDSTAQPILSVGKNVSKNVYAETEYHHNAPEGENTAQLEVQYEFAPRWSLETFFGDAAEGGIAIFWGFAFDTGPAKTVAPAK